MELSGWGHYPVLDCRVARLPPAHSASAPLIPVGPRPGALGKEGTTEQSPGTGHRKPTVTDGAPARRRPRA